MEKRIAIGLVLTLMTVVLLGIYTFTQNQRMQGFQEKLQEEAAVRGAITYLATCTNCHGPKGEGGVGPALRNTSLDEAALIQVVSKGRPGTLMPSWSTDEGGPLKKPQIEDLATFIKHWKDEALEKALAHAPAAASPAPGIAAPSVEGEQIYRSVVPACAGCHGDQGEGKIAPRLAGTALTLERLKQAVRNPRSLNPRGEMPSFTEKQISDSDVEKVFVWLESLAGKGLFSSVSPSCAGCHGAQGEGGIGPRVAGTTLSLDTFQRQVRNPRSRNTASLMPAFTTQQVNESDLKKIYDWLKGLPMQ